jgi:hypothetical protein
MQRKFKVIKESREGIREHCTLALTQSMHSHPLTTLNVFLSYIASKRAKEIKEQGWVGNEKFFLPHENGRNK